MNKNDKRVFASRKLLKEALIRLLQHKTLDQISVTELSKESGISRTTYYRNHNSLEEILVKYLHDWYKQTFLDILSRGSGRHVRYCFFCETEKELDLFKAMVKCKLDHWMMMESMNCLRTSISDMYGTLELSSSDQEYNYTLYAFTGQAHTSVLYWIDNPHLTAIEIDQLFDAYVDLDGLLSLLPIYKPRSQS